MRIIPRETKVRVEFYRNVTLGDMILGVCGAGLEILLFLTNFGVAQYMIMAALLGAFICLYMPIDGQRLYLQIGSFFRFYFSRKKYTKNSPDPKSDVDTLFPFTGIHDSLIDYGTSVAGVMEIPPKEFRLLSSFKQSDLIDRAFASVIRSIGSTARASLVKIDRPVLMDDYIRQEEEKKPELDKTSDSGGMTREEIVPRKNIIDRRTGILKTLNKDAIVYRGAYYLVVYDTTPGGVAEVLRTAKQRFAERSMNCRRLDDAELAVFLKYNYTTDFDERDIRFYQPEEYVGFAKPDSVSFTMNRTNIDGRDATVFTVRNYPLTVTNAWGYQIFNIPDTKVVMNIAPIEKSKAVRRIDRSLQELLTQNNNSFKASDIIDRQTHIDSLVDLLQMLQNDNEALYEVTLHVTVYSDGDKGQNSLRKRVRSLFAEAGLRLSDNSSKQIRAFTSANISPVENMREFLRSIHSSSIAAVFPFVRARVMDDRGVLLGHAGGFPVITDFFRRDNERVNSNMVIMGKSGSGKSFATKTLLANLSAENCKIFILDPENEYQALARNLGGKLIDVGTAREGRLNPFHVITTLDSDETGELGAVSTFSVHLQFLEEFFKQILIGIQPDALEYLNNLILKMYTKAGICITSDFSKLTPADYPTFDQLFALICEEQELAKTEYDISNLRILYNYITKFAGTGRNANLWNGESSLSVTENFTVFNFQSLLANKNNSIANAQMLLVLKWLDNEIIKNRDFNTRHNTNRKIIVVIDEAHVFIDNKYPIALDFMFQLAKRIRKYNGMQIVITQNIKDFVGSPEIARKSTAIINACQYSLIFALSPNDMDDLCTLYEKAGEINETEQQDIINNDRGCAFMITGPLSRTNINIVASDELKALFGEAPSPSEVTV